MQTLILALGVEDKVVECKSVLPSAWWEKIQPSVANIPTAFNGSSLNVEQLLALTPDVYITPYSDTNIAAVEGVGIPVVEIDIDNWAGLQQSMLILGQVFGDSATAKAEQFNTYFENTINEINSTISTSSTGTSPSVAFLFFYVRDSVMNMMAFGSDTQQGSWIIVDGGSNAVDFEGAKAINMETVLNWNPEIIVYTAPSGTPMNLTVMQNDSLWSQVSAVQNSQVYFCPEGLWTWSGTSVESALMVQWGAKLLHPDLFPDLNLSAETMSFYETFYGYSLTEVDANNILSHSSPS
jgi:iron complex transport system substrate-binding protein